METILPAFLEFGMPGIFIALLVYDRYLAKKEYREDLAKRDLQIAELHNELRKTIREVFPMVDTLSEVLRVVQGGKNG